MEEQKKRGELSPVAMKRLPSELKNLRNKGHRVIVDDNDLSRWQVKLVFPSDTPLGMDLERMKEHGVDCILLELDFPYDYPMHCPFVRIISPRIQFLSAGITFGGTINGIHILTNKGWTAVMTVDYILVNVKKHLEENGARIDLEATQRFYTIEEARASQYRTQLITSREIPTKGSFKHKYTCISSSAVQRDGLSTGNKVLLPESALGELSDTNISPPFCFEIKTTNHMRTYCGVLEFVAQPDQIVLPDHMMRSLFLNEEEQVDIRSVSLPRGTHVTFQPHSSKLIGSVNNDRNRMIALLEWCLPKYSTLTMGDTIEVQHAGQIYLLNIIETQPAQAVSLIGEPYLDIKIDFAPALDFVDESTKPSEDIKESEESKGMTLAHEALRESQAITCGNCKRLVPKGSVMMHENMCYRLNTICPRCNGVVKKEELKSHIADLHALVDCPCGQKVEKIQMEEHKTTACGLRQVQCGYCLYSCLANELEHHSLQCGTRTQLCDHCQNYVQVKDMISHLQSCKFNPDAEMNVIYRQFQCPLCETSLKEIVLDDNERSSITLFNSEEDFILHVKNTHNNDPPLKVVCPICDSKHKAEGLTTTPKPVESLYKHMNIHEVRLLKEQQWKFQRRAEKFT